jgi:hypothetical protein
MNFFHTEKCIADIAQTDIFIATTISVDLYAAIKEELVQVDVDTVLQKANSFSDVYWEL